VTGGRSAGPTVGLVGGYGKVGLHAARRLAGEGFAVRLGGRSGAAAQAAASAVGGEGRRVDLDDGASLAAFCRGCDLVINCAGPALVVRDRVALAALEAGTHYLDPGGYDPLYASLRARGADVAAAGLRFVVNAGLLPGLSGVFPLYAMGRGLERVDRLECYYVGRDHWSYSSAYDIACSLGEFGAETGPAYVRGGERARAGLTASFRRVALPPPVDKLVVFLIYTEELRRLAQEHRVPAVYGYGANNGRWTSLAMAWVKALRRYRTEAQRESSARLIAAASARDMARAAPCFAIHVVAEGSAAGRPRRVLATLMTGDTYEATGLITALAAEAMLRGRAQAGASMLHEAVDASDFMERAARAGLTWTYEEVEA
jgi:saccharopine dehydrogenase (NAD+, L-lysine forming)